MMKAQLWRFQPAHLIMKVLVLCLRGNLHGYKRSISTKGMMHLIMTAALKHLKKDIYDNGVTNNVQYEK